MVNKEVVKKFCMFVGAVAIVSFILIKLGAM